MRVEVGGGPVLFSFLIFSLCLNRLLVLAEKHGLLVVADVNGGVVADVPEVVAVAVLVELFVEVYLVCL